MNDAHSKMTRRELLEAAAALISLSVAGAASAQATNGQSEAAATRPTTTNDIKSRRDRSMPSTVLVTGGTGYVGGWCVVELLRRGYVVRTTLRNPAKESAVRAAVATQVAAGDRLSFFTADLLREEGWNDALAGCDHVLHVASPLGGGDVKEKNALLAPARDGALRVLRAAIAAGVKRVIMTSAATAATPPMTSPDRISDETVWFDPSEDVDPYRHSKRLAERAAWDFMKGQRSATTFATVLPGAVFGPVLSSESDGSTEVIARLLQGKVPMNPRFGLQIVDVRDLADLHIRAMTAANAAGERFLGVGDFMWMADVSKTLRDELGDAAKAVPKHNMPDILYRLAAMFDPSLNAMTPRLGKMHRHTAAKAQQLLDWHSRPAKATIVDCAKSLIEHKLA